MLDNKLEMRWKLAEDIEILERHSVSCVTKIPVPYCHAEEATEIEGVAIRELYEQSILRVAPIQSLGPQTRSLSVPWDIVTVIPSIPKAFFLWTIYAALAFVLLLPWPAAYVSGQLTTAFPHPPEPSWLFAISQILDPLFIHFLTYLILTWVLYSIARRKGFDKVESLILGGGLPLLIVLTSFLLSDFVLKPGLAFSRESLYNPNLEPLLTRTFQQFLGGPGERVPSGFTVRQVALSMTLYWFGLHSESPLRVIRQTGRRNPAGKTNLAIISFLTAILLLLVIAQRLYVRAHDLFDVTLGIGYGIILFWIAAPIITALVTRFAYRPSLVILGYSASAWFIAGAGMLFYSGDPRRWVISWLWIFFVLGMFRLLPVVLARIKASRASVL